MKEILFIIIASYIVQAIINLGIAVYNCNYKGATIGDVVEEMMRFHRGVWIPIFGLIIQIIFLVYMLFSKIWKRLKTLRIR